VLRWCFFACGVYVLSLFFFCSSPGTVPAFPFYRCKGSTGLQVMFLWEKRSEVSGPVVGGVLLLEEWPPSSNVVATCPDGRSPVATKCRIMIITVAMCLSLWFDRRREPRPRWRDHGVISLHLREQWPRAAPRRPRSCECQYGRYSDQ
jgi:hypothetical protein